MKYVNLIIDNKSDKTDQLYTYGCEYENVSVGQKVYVPFARSKKLREAYVFQVMEETEKEFKNLKYVDSIDEEISLTKEIIETCKWMKKRYLCRFIDGIRLFTPSGKPSKTGKERKPFLSKELEPQIIENLTSQQKEALEKIEEPIHENKHDLFLLHGITGSGKTEVYMQAIEVCIEKKKNAIMLVPEISLTTQIVERFVGRFGEENIAILHSKLSLGERYDQWQRIRQGKVKIVIGARSAIFAPIDNIGIVILDEEHESTYKSDMTPKYDTVEVAIKRAKFFNGVVVLGSATPSVVSFFRSENGIYKKIKLDKRYNEVALPSVEVVDMRAELKNGNTSIFSNVLYEDIKKNLEMDKQVILFLNRRGYSTFISCRECGYVSKCEECGISLTYHKNENLCICHYCGKKEPPPNICPDCGSKYIKYFGTGTQKVEEEISRLFEDYKVQRLDLDTAKKKDATRKILKSFEKKEINILIGTQIVAKGLDFKNVGLVGIVAADITLNIPDFRSAERTFQLITQAAGRAGRGEEKGKVIIQSYNPENYAVLAAANQNYDEFFENEIAIREFMEYPPFSDLIQVVLSSSKENIVEQGMKSLEFKLKEMTKNCKGTFLEAGEIVTMNNKEQYKKCILIKSLVGERNIYMGAIESLKEGLNKSKSELSISVDVNPYNMWR